jgi:hypothetical protein
MQLHVAIRSVPVYDNLDTPLSWRGNLDFPALHVPHPYSIIVDFLIVDPIALVLESEPHMPEVKVVSRGACPLTKFVSCMIASAIVCFGHSCTPHYAMHISSKSIHSLKEPHILHTKTFCWIVRIRLFRVLFGDLFWVWYADIPL